MKKQKRKRIAYRSNSHQENDEWCTKKQRERSSNVQSSNQAQRIYMRIQNDEPKDEHRISDVRLSENAMQLKIHIEFDIL